MPYIHVYICAARNYYIVPRTAQSGHRGMEVPMSSFSIEAAVLARKA